MVITGYGSKMMAEKLAEIASRNAGIGIRTVYNPFYAVADNLASCWLAREEMDGEFIQVNGDNLFRAAMIDDFLKAPDAAVTVAINQKGEYDNDDMKVMLDGDRLTEIGKTLPLEAVTAEAIGIYRFSGEGARMYRDVLETAMLDPSGLKQWFPSAIGSLAKIAEIKVCSITGHEWCEVDFPVDLQHARQLVAGW